MNISYKTAESVCAGHPDKLCDIIADAILDECLKKDRYSRVACEVMATKGKIFVCGEITCSKKIDIRLVVRQTLAKVGYNPLKFIVFVYVHRQSADIAGGVNKALETREVDTDDIFASIGAGDQGTVYGYATNETWAKMPTPVLFANDLCKRLDDAMHDGTIRDIGPDGKAQVTVEYQDGKPVCAKNIIVSVQHKDTKSLDELRREIITEIIYPLLNRYHFPNDTEILINPSGRFVAGGPAADTGLTGRKLMVDTYGGLAAHGGGAFSGKDATKVDRSGAYMARAVARNIVGAWLADRCQVSISYAIGKAEPTAVEIDTFGTEKVDVEIIRKAVMEVFDLRPAAIISLLHLRNPYFSETTAYGHFNGYKGSWENLDKTKELKKAVEKYAD
ncbi:methionine adenosyltransferase [Ligilactobacillus murinus]|uniref:methionine adenosyltransferase n=1 Tax=Ligilactobacillus murinus TaxID=1622 RepID=UPI0023EC1021|nr:methionine adenosyltransferase [Ligilactobacillus murinus]WET88681.1 methionine adenosyltransferase [Ligilactobacillus murinus]